MPWELPVYVVHQRLLESQLGEELPWSLTDYHIPSAWDGGVVGQDIIVGIVDTGIDSVHTTTGDLKGQCLDAKDFSGSRSGYADRAGHGTHVAGTIAAVYRNGLGVAGVAPACKLYIAKALNDQGSGTEDSIAAAIRWLVSKGCVIVNMSLGSPQPSLAIRSACDEAARQGVLMVVAAGNSGGDVGYPAKWESCLAVSAFDRDRKPAQFTCRGPEIDIGAPGAEILSTYLNGTYSVLSGTSMACPWVSGVLALRLSWEAAHGGIKTTTVEKAKAWLTTASDDVGAPGHDEFSGPGLPNGKKLFNGAAAKPIEDWDGLTIPFPLGEAHFPAKEGDLFGVSLKLGAKELLVQQLTR